mgnify:CR=1 FL=1
MNLFRTGSLLSALGVALGAFGAHGLRDRIEPALLQAWNTGVLYHLVHALALVALGLAGARGARRRGALLLLAGIALFSGSLYAMALTGFRPLGAVTPVGGVLFLAGWLQLAFAREA